MVNITKLYCGEEQPADGLRYGHGHGAPKSAAERRPIVVWNVTRTCNLRCVHCYCDSYRTEIPGRTDPRRGNAGDRQSRGIQGARRVVLGRRTTRRGPICWN